MTLEQQYKNVNQRFQHSASDKEIYAKMGITFDEFRQLSDRIKALKPGSMRKLTSRNSASANASLTSIFNAQSEIGTLLTWRRSVLRKKLARAIEALPKMEKLVVSLYYYDELTLREIASVLKTNEFSISRLFTIAMLRIRSKLRE